jgi:4-alpha-glucanotransferase
MREIDALHALARYLGVHTRFTDGLMNLVEPEPDTLVRICAAMGAPVEGPAGAEEALEEMRARADARRLPPTVVAWDGALPELPVALGAEAGGTTGMNPDALELVLEDGSAMPVKVEGGTVRLEEPLPLGYHELRLRSGEAEDRCRVISAPSRAFHRAGGGRSWGIGTHMAALRSSRSRSIGDLRDLETACEWVGRMGGDLVTVLPLLPTFNDAHDPEPSPYSPVSRLFWSELVLDLGEHHRPVRTVARLDVSEADAEVRRALAGSAAPPPGSLDEELAAYARFRGAQKRLGRNWRSWPAAAREGRLGPEHVDPIEERFHQVAQLEARRQLTGLRRRLEERGVRLGLDLAVGAHPDGYDTWSRKGLFAPGMSVGAPPDPGFPSGQDWGFSPVLPEASRLEGHRYLAASIAHQASLSGVLRVDHVMAFMRLYWIPHGMGLHEGTYVDYPMDELFALLTLESVRHRCEVVGENLGTVPSAVNDDLERHGIQGMYLALFQAATPHLEPPGDGDMALIGTHDTPTLAGWVAGADIGERVRCGLLDPDAEESERAARAAAAERLAETLDGSLDDLPDLLDRLLDWLGASDSPLVVPWLEDLWLEGEQVNLPGTRSSDRPNWQRLMALGLEDAFADPRVVARVRRLAEARGVSATPSLPDRGSAP